MGRNIDTHSCLLLSLGISASAHGLNHKILLLQELKLPVELSSRTVPFSFTYSIPDPDVPFLVFIHSISTEYRPIYKLMSIYIDTQRTSPCSG